MKRILLLTLVFSLGHYLLGQSLEVDWIRNSGGPLVDHGVTMAITEEGHVITGIEFSGTADFDTGPSIYPLTSNGGIDICIQKLDENGDFLWAYSFGGSGNDYVTSIETTPSGEIYIGGYFEDTIDLDPGPDLALHISSGARDYFIAKYDADLNHLWSRHTGGSSYDYLAQIALDSSGNIYIAGSFQNTVDFDPGPAIVNHTVVGERDAYIARYNAAGDFIWVKTFAGIGVSRDVVRSISVAEDGTIYGVGSFSNTLDADPGPDVFNLYASGYSDIFEISLTSDGDFIWGKSIGSIGADVSYRVATDNLKNSYITGEFWGTVDFDPGPGYVGKTSNGNQDIFVLKLDSSGNFQWVTTMGDNNDDTGWCIAVDRDQNVYSIGHFRGTVDFDPGPDLEELTSFGSSDVYIQKLNPDGDLIEVARLGGPNTEFGHWITTLEENVYVTGTFSTTADFDPSEGEINRTTTGSYDFFVEKFSTCSTAYGIDSLTACDSLTWIDGITYYESNYETTHTIPGGALGGCDSIVTLNLRIITIDDEVTATAYLLIANEDGADYQWVNCNKMYAPIPGATDQAFAPEEDGEYAVIITNSGCTDTSECIDFISEDEEELGINRDTKTRINVYPNPFQDYTTITFDESPTVPYSIVIYDNIGREVFRAENISESTLRLERNNLRKGVYTLVLIKEDSNEEPHLIKLVIQ